jgi:hypothetical protein
MANRYARLLTARLVQVTVPQEILSDEDLPSVAEPDPEPACPTPDADCESSLLPQPKIVPSSILIKYRCLTRIMRFPLWWPCASAPAAGSRTLPSSPRAGGPNKARQPHARNNKTQGRTQIPRGKPHIKLRTRKLLDLQRCLAWVTSIKSCSPRTTDVAPRTAREFRSLAYSTQGGLMRLGILPPAYGEGFVP